MYVDMLEQKVPHWRLVNSARQLQNSLRTWTCESETNTNRRHGNQKQKRDINQDNYRKTPVDEKEFCKLLS